MTHSFTLDLGEMSDAEFRDISDSLYEAGCDDALPSWFDGAARLDFDREAPSRAQAIASALENVRAAGFRAHLSQDDD